MVKLIDLFESPKDWIIELDDKSLYNDPIKDERNIYHYVYCWVNCDTQWCYVGYHTSITSDNSEGYLGSSGNAHYWNSRKLHEFKCYILGYALTKDEGYELESRIIDEDIISKYSENGLFNLTIGGYSGYAHLGSKSLLRYNIDRQFESIHKHMNYIINNYGELDPYHYAFHNYDGFDCRRQHIRGVLNRMDLLLEDPRWTPEMSNLFKHFYAIDQLSRSGFLIVNNNV